MSKHSGVPPREDEMHPRILMDTTPIPETSAAEILFSEPERADYFSHHDSLTGLLNRQSFNEHLQHLLSGTHQLYVEHAMIYLDLDQFKIINDVCSTAAGDHILGQISMQLRNFVRKSDIVARLGNDTFGLVLLHCQNQNAIRVAENIRLAIKNTDYTFLEMTHKITASMGVVPFTAKSDTVTSVLSKATTACAMAKDQGRDRICLYQEADDVMTSRFGEIACISTINKALDKDKFLLYCQRIEPLQPQYHELEHYEVLVRMLDDDSKIVSPSLFLPAAERYHIISRIDRWVLKNTLQEVMRMPERLKTIGKIAVNLSGQSLNDVDFPQYVKELLQTTQMPPEKLCFEITETGTIGNISNAIRFINQMKQLNVVFSLDDFGTGLSSFGYLKNLPVDYLKIDGIFIKNILQDPTDAAMVRSINEIGHVLGKKTIAEFVENNEVREFLRDMGLDYVQGYGISEPRPLRDIFIKK